MRPMFSNPIGTIDAKNTSLCEAVESENVIMLHAAKLHIIAVHKIKQIDARLHLLFLMA